MSDFYFNMNFPGITKEQYEALKQIKEELWKISKAKYWDYLYKAPDMDEQSGCFPTEGDWNLYIQEGYYLLYGKKLLCIGGRINGRNYKRMVTDSQPISDEDIALLETQQEFKELLGRDWFDTEEEYINYLIEFLMEHRYVWLPEEPLTTVMLQLHDTHNISHFDVEVHENELMRLALVD